MRKLLPLCTLVAAASSLHAAPVFYSAGTNLGYGGGSNLYSTFAGINNPASAASLLELGENRYGIGLVSGGFSIEIGQVDSLTDQLTELRDGLKDLTDDKVPLMEKFDKGVKLTEDFTDFLRLAGRDGYIQFAGGAHVPLFPMIIAVDSIGGAVSLDASIALQGRMGILVDQEYPIQVIDPLTGSVNPDSATSLYIKGAQQIDVAAAYSRPILALGKNQRGGILYAGMRVRMVRIGLTKTIINLIETADELEDTLRDLADKGLTTTTNLAVDGGLFWSASNYRIGLSINNINQPEFNYPELGRCANLTGSDLSNCQVAISFADSVNLIEVHKMNSQAKLEAAWTSLNRKWVLGVNYDLNAATDPLGNELQYLNISGGYATSGFIPGFRLGYRTNRVGSALSEALFGFTVLKVLNLDFAWGLDTIKYEDKSLPRSFAFNLSTELSF
jgi:hypothetical protein